MCDLGCTDAFRPTACIMCPPVCSNVVIGGILRDDGLRVMDPIAPPHPRNCHDRDRNRHHDRDRDRRHDHDRHNCVMDPIDVYVVHDPQLTDRMDNCNAALDKTLAGMTVAKHVADRFTVQHIADADLVGKVVVIPECCCCLEITWCCCDRDRHDRDRDHYHKHRHRDDDRCDRCHKHRRRDDRDDRDRCDRCHKHRRRDDRDDHDDSCYQPREMLNMRAVSNSLNHLDALTAIARGGCAAAPMTARRHSIIVEDDIVATCWAEEVIRMVLRNLPDDYDIVLLGGNCRPARYGEFVKLCVYDGAARTVGAFRPFRSTEAYIVSPRAAQALSQAYLPFATGHNEHLAALCVRLGLKVYQVNHSVFLDGSKTGAYIGTINAEDYDLPYNDAFMTIKAVVDSPRASQEEIDGVAKYVAATQHVHPHFRFLIARFFMKVRDFASALTHLRYCMDCYKTLFCNVWKLHVFVLEYMLCCKLEGMTQTTLP